MTIHLQAGVHFCVAAGAGVFLDLRRDSYSSVPLVLPASGREIAQALTAEQLSDALEAHADALLEAGLITRESCAGSGLDAFLAIERCNEEVHEGRTGRTFGLSGLPARGLGIGISDIWAVAGAWRSALSLLKHRHIGDIVRRVRMRQEKLAARPNTRSLKRDVAVFSRLRPWCPAPYVCLQDSLTLMAFLQARGHAADWVFGVRMQPFAAHSWVQASGVLLNEGAEYAGFFTPILRV